MYAGLGGKRKVRAVNMAGFVVILHLPVVACHFDNVAIILVLVHKGHDTFCRTQRYVVFRGVASGHNSNVTFHDAISICYALIPSIYLSHLASKATMSAARSVVKSISLPVLGCLKPNVRACNACRGQMAKQLRIKLL